MDTRISGTTALYGVIGSPIQHTKSPIMYNFCFQHYQMDAVYLAFSCKEDEVTDTLLAMRRLNMRGMNVTMPCKQAVAKQMDHLSKAASLVGAVNTIVNNEGILTGHITDGEGVIADLKDHGQSIVDKDVVLLGAGGAAMAIFVQLALDGAKKITVCNRGEKGLQKARAIGEQIKKEGLSCSLSFLSLNDMSSVHQAVANADVLIHATSVGMSGVAENQSLITDMQVFHHPIVIYDVVYNPAITQLMRDAKENGVPDSNIIGGKGMLLWQGASAFKLYTGKEMPIKELKSFLA